MGQRPSRTDGDIVEGEGPLLPPGLQHLGGHPALVLGPQEGGDGRDGDAAAEDAEGDEADGEAEDRPEHVGHWLQSVGRPGGGEVISWE